MLAASALPCIQQRCIKKENPTNALESETTLVVSQAPLRWAQHTQNAQGTKQSPESCSETARRTARLSHAVSLWCSKEVVCNSACDTRQVPVNAETILKVFSLLQRYVSPTIPVGIWMPPKCPTMHTHHWPISSGLGFGFTSAQWLVSFFFS